MTFNLLTSEKINRRFVDFLAFFLLILSTFIYLNQYSTLLFEGDIWWHIKAGQDILSTGKFPQIDGYSYTFAGQPWFAKEWLAQVIYAAAYNSGGWNVVLLVGTLAMSGALALMFLDISMYLKPTIAAFIVIICIFMLLVVGTIRPHILTFIPAVILTVRIFGNAERNEAPDFWLLPLIIVWANLHGSFTLGIITAGFAFLHYFERNRFSNRAVLTKWLVFMCLCPLVSLINPYGIKPLLLTFSMVGGVNSMDHISEWKALDFHVDKLVSYAYLLSIGALLLARPKLSLAKVFFLLLITYMMMYHARFIYVYFLLVPLIVAKEIANENPRISNKHWATLPRDRLETFVSKWMGTIIVGGTLIGLGLFGFYATRTPFSPPKTRTLEGAIAYIEKQHLTGPMLNGYNLGGPLLFHGIKTFIDGRSDQLFLGDFFEQYMKTGEDADTKALAGILTKYKIEWTIFEKQDVQNDYFTTLANWNKTYGDDQVTIYELKK